MQEMLKLVIDTYGIQFGTGAQIAVMLAAFLFWITEKNTDRQEDMRKSLLVKFLILFTFIYACPVTAKIITKYCVEETVYWRMFWLVPVPIILAYLLTWNIFRAEVRWKRMALIAVTIGLVIVSGNAVYNGTNFTKASNPYKLNQDVLVVCDAIEADASANAIEEKGVVVPEELVTEIRQYDTDLYMPYGRDTLRGYSKKNQDILGTMRGEPLDCTKLAYQLQNTKYNYVVYRVDDTVKESMEQNGFAMVADVGNYYVYRRTQENKKSWLVTQYGDPNGNQWMFYTILDPKGRLIVIDGGWETNADYTRSVIAGLGNHVHAWILTHPHEDHIGAFCTIYGDPQGMKIDQIYTVDMASPQLCMDNASWDSVDMYQRFLSLDVDNLTYVYPGDELKLCGLNMKVFNAYTDKVDELSSDLLNDGSMMFKLTGKEESILFCADVGKHMSDYLMSEYGEELQADYIQMGHHGNGGLTEDFYRLVAPKTALFDAPNWLLEGSDPKYTTPENLELMESLGCQIDSFATAPNSFRLY